RGAIAALAHALAYFQAIEHGHRDIEDDCVVGVVDHALECVAAVARERHLVALQGERARERVLDCGLVVDDQYARWICMGLRPLLRQATECAEGEAKVTVAPET